MANQLSIYISEPIAKKARAKAKAKKFKSLSEYVVDLIRKDLDGNQRGWPPGFRENVIGSWQGDFPEIEELPLQERDKI